LDWSAIQFVVSMMAKQQTSLLTARRKCTAPLHVGGARQHRSAESDELAGKRASDVTWITVG
jgi:hypothetical protein